MKVSNCCGASYSNGDSSSEDYGICPDCKEHCEYVEEEEEAEEGSIMADMADLKKLLDKHKALTEKN